jgi:putative phosphoribosyl transferase
MFANRSAAGIELASRLLASRLAKPVVLALPRGGVPVAVEIALALNAPIDLVFVRKIGVPEQPELAAAAIVDGEKPELVINDRVVAKAGVDRSYLERQSKIELAEIDRRRRLYLSNRSRIRLEGHDLVLVDDGIATGTSMQAALAALKRKRPRRLVLAVPVAPRDTIEALKTQVDELICLETPDPFFAIGLHYADFHQLSDQEVLSQLDRVPVRRPAQSASVARAGGTAHGD